MVVKGFYIVIMMGRILLYVKGNIPRRENSNYFTSTEMGKIRIIQNLVNVNIVNKQKRRTSDQTLEIIQIVV